MTLRIVLALGLAVLLATDAFAGDCGCTGVIGAPAISCTSSCDGCGSGCCTSRCCRLFPTPGQLFRGFHRAIDCMLPCNCSGWSCGYVGGGGNCCGGGCGSPCGSRWSGWVGSQGCGLWGSRHGGCGSGCGGYGRHSCAASLWPPLHCCPYDNGCRSCGMNGGYGNYGGYDEGGYDAGPMYSSPQNVPTPAPQMEMAPAVPPDMQPNGSPFQDDPNMPMMQTRTLPRRSGPVGVGTPKPVATSRPIKQTSVQQPTLSQPRVNAQPTQKSTSTRSNSKISPASHEAELEIQEPVKLQLPTITTSRLPANPLR